MRFIPQLVFTALSLTLTIPTAQAAKIYRQYSYYTVSGKTAAQIDHSIAQKGPYLSSTNRHHPGVTRVQFLPNIKLERKGKYCKVKKVTIDVRAKVYLPRWKQRNSTRSPELAFIWDILSRDIKRHEESHIIIARSHATEMEHKIGKLFYRRDCQDLKNDINKVVTTTLAKHDAAQKRFDRVEAINFDRRFTRLLKNQIRNLAKR